MGEEFLDDAFGDIDGDGEAEVVAGVDAAGVDADDFAAEVDERSAGISRIDGGIHLEPVVEPSGFVLVDIGVIKETVGVGDDAGGDGASEAEGRADGHNGLSESDLGGIAEVGEGEGEAFAFDFIEVELDEGEVGPMIGADQLGADVFKIEEGHVEAFGAAGDVEVGEDVALLVDDDAAADGTAGTGLALDEILGDDVDADDGGADGVGGVADGVAGAHVDLRRGLLLGGCCSSNRGTPRDEAAMTAAEHASFMHAPR